MMKATKFNRRCCFNCAHHLDYRMNGVHTNTLVCSIKAQKTYTLDNGFSYVGVDYTQRMSADTPPCDKWQIDTNVPKGFKWNFEKQPIQLTLFY